MVQAKRKSTKPRRPAKRAQGRPLGDPIGPDVLLKATRELLSSTSPVRVTRHDIARKAGVDPALIRYYFGTKDVLLAEVIEAIAKEVEEASTGGLTDSSTPTEQLTQFLRGWHAVLSLNPSFHQLIIEQIIVSANPRVKKLQKDFPLRGLAYLTGIMQRGVASGEFRAVEPRALIAAMLGLCEITGSAWPAVEAFLESKYDRATFLTIYSNFIVDLVLSGLAPRPDPPSNGVRRRAKTKAR